MSHLMDRVGKAWRRLSVDGRIPRSTWDLYSRYWSLKAREALGGFLGAFDRMFRRNAPGTADMVRPAGTSRWWQVVGEPYCSAFELAHDNARAVVDHLVGAGMRPYLIEGDDRSLHFGLSAEDRSRALRALRSMESGPWYISWVRGGATRVDLLHRAGSRVANAESWSIFRLFRVGDERVIGRAEGVMISFWAESETGQRERLGYRGLNRFDPATVSETTEALVANEYPGLDVFPVARALGHEEHIIDFVYTWVDDSDENWRSDFAQWAGRVGDSSDQADHAARFRSLDELRYSLRSLWLYAGWVNHIYLVTSGQVPEWLIDHPRLTVITHSEIMPAWAIPTFNSHAIEASLHHIPNLAEKFVYMNDDVFLARPLGRDRFFTSDGRLKYVESEAMMPVSRAAITPAVELAAVNNRHAIESAFNRLVKWRLDHAPHPLRKSVMADAESRFAGQLGETVSHRFRHPDDLSLASGLSQFVAACTGRGVPADLVNRYMNIENARFGMFLEVLRLDEGIDSFCINQTDVAAADPDAEGELKSFLDAYLSVPAPWERR